MAVIMSAAKNLALALFSAAKCTRRTLIVELYSADVLDRISTGT
jgi:hypothetical protein